MALFLDTFGRTNSSTSPGVADTGQTWATVTGYTRLGISSNTLYNPNATAGVESLALGAREFDATIVVGTIGTGFTFSWAVNSTFTESLNLAVSSTAVTLTDTVRGQLRTASVTVASAATIRVRVTRKSVSVWVGGTLQFTFNTTAYPNHTGIAFTIAGSFTGTVASIAVEAISHGAGLDVTDLLAEVRELIDEADSTNTNHSDANIYIHMGRTTQDITGRLPVYRQKYTITGTGDGDQTHALPAYVTKIDYVTDGTRKIHPIGRESRLTDYGDRLRFTDGLNVRSSGYWLDGDRIGFEPALGSSDTRYVYYFGQHDDLDADSLIDLPAYFAQAIVFGTLFRIMLKERDPQASEYKALYEDELRKARGNWNRSHYSELN